MAQFSPLIGVLTLLLLCSPSSDVWSRMLSDTEYEAYRSTQKIRGCLEIAKSQFLVREPIFLRSWIENRGTTTAYFHWAKIPRIALRESERNFVPECWPGRGQSLFTTKTIEHSGGISRVDFAELRPGEQSSNKLTEITDLFGTGPDNDCRILRSGSYVVYFPGIETDTVRFSIVAPQASDDSTALALFESASAMVTSVPAGSTVQHSTSLPLYSEQVPIFSRVFQEHRSSVYALAAAERLLGYGYSDLLEPSLRKQLEFALLEVAELGYVVHLANLDPNLYSAEERLFLKSRFQQLSPKYVRTTFVGEFIVRVSQQLTSPER